jgi:hypothetical protein
MTKNVIFRVVFLSLSILLIAGASYGQTQINGAASGNWGSTSSWSPATVPNNGMPSGSTYDVTLLSSPAVDITLNISPTIDTLTVDSGSELTANASETLTTTGLTNAGYIDFGNGNTLTVNGATTTSGTLALGSASKGNFNGSLTNSSSFETSGGSTATVSGAFTNNSGGVIYLESTGDVLKVGSLTNNSEVYINTGATLDITGGGSGITDVVAGSSLYVSGTFNVINGGTPTNALADLTTVAGTLIWENGQTLTDTPTGGTLTINSGGALETYSGSKLTLTGSDNVSNSGDLFTDGGSTVTVPGTLTNNSGGFVYLESSGDVLNVGSLSNNSEVYINTGATLNITGGGSGITTVAAGSSLYVLGALNVINGGTPSNGLANLTTVAGTLEWGNNGQTLTDTPTGGTLTINSGGVLETYGGSKLTLTGTSNVSNSGDLYTDGGSTVTVPGTLTNSGFVYLQSSGDVLNVGSLSNSAEVYINTGATLNITGGGSGITTVAAGSSLYVLGALNVINSGTPSNGLANLTTVAGTLGWQNGQTLTDTPTGGTLTINSGGALEVYSGSTLTLTGTDSVSNSGGLYTASKSTVTIPGTLTNNMGGFVYLESSGDVLNVGSLSNSAEVYINTGATLNITGGGSGITTVAAGSSLYVLGTLNVVNGGTPSNGLADLATVAGTLELGNGQTLTDTPMSGTLTVTGSLQVYSGSTLSVANVSNSGNLYTDAMGTVTITGTLTNSGSIYLESSGDVLNVGTLTNTDSVFLDPGATLNLTGAASTNSKTITLDSGGILEISAAKVTISGDGIIDLIGAGNIIEGAASSDVLTLAKGGTIEGSGNIGNNLMGLNNQGIIDAQQAGNPLIIQAVGTTSNSGTMEATVGATLQLDAGTYTQTSTGAIIASETGSALSTVNLENGVVINGGKLTITGTTAAIDLVGTTPTLTLNGVTISGTGSLQLPDGSTTTLLGTNSNTSTIDLNSTASTTTLEIGAASVTLSGAGKIILASDGKDVITGAASSDKLTSANTIEGPGNIGNGNMGLVNTGIIETVAHQTGQTVIDASSAGFTNQGTVEAVASTTLYINNAAGQFTNYNSGTDTLTGGTYIVDGILEFDGASITTDAANITLSGSTAKLENSTNSANALTNLNTIAASSSFDIISQTFTTTGNFTNNGTLAVGSGSKFTVDLSDSLTNFNSTTDTLTGGAYNVTGTLEFAGADIVNNDATIILTGTAAKILNQSAVNALTGFVNNEAGATFEVTGGNVFTTGSSFTNNGTLTVGSSTSKFVVNLADSLTNFSGGTLTGGTYDLTGILQFAGDIATNDANITLTGTSAKILDGSGNSSLTTFATNASGASFEVTGGNVFTTGGSFTNNGTLTVGSSTSKFIVNSADSLTNFNSGTTTLTGGTYNVTGILQFAGANIVNNAASITLTGTTSAIENSSAANGLASFANNTSTGSFTLAGDRTFTTLGAFTNEGAMDISLGSTFTVTGAGDNYMQSAGSTTVDGTLTVNAASTVDITGGTLFGATDNINGNVDLTGGVVNPGNGVDLIGELKVTGTYTQGSAGTVTIDLGGKTAITQYSVLDITKASSLSGTLDVTLVNGFTPVVGDTFDIIDYLSNTGTFTTLNLPTLSGGDEWTETYGAKGLVLEVVSGGAVESGSTSQGIVSASPARRVSRAFGDVSATSTHEPVAILSRVTCFAARSGSCDRAATTAAHGGETAFQATSSASSTISATPHNNIMVVTRSISEARSGASHETSVSATAMARLYVCAYLPSTVGHTMGCN